MSDETVVAILQRAATDPEFRAQLGTAPDEALKPYVDRGDLSSAEVSMLKALKPSILEGIHDAMLAEVDRKWWQPSSFRDLGAAGLTVLLAIGVGFVLAWVLARVGTPPTAYKIGTGPFQSFDSFQRSKDVFTVVIPLFAAALSFWFGVSVEGRRADAATEQAAAATQQAGQATDSAKKSDQRVAAVLDQSGEGALHKAKVAFPKLFQAWDTGG